MSKLIIEFSLCLNEVSDLDNLYNYYLINVITNEYTSDVHGEGDVSLQCLYGAGQLNRRGGLWCWLALRVACGAPC